MTRYPLCRFRYRCRLYAKLHAQMLPKKGPENSVKDARRNARYADNATSTGVVERKTRNKKEIGIQGERPKTHVEWWWW
jgi:hypothetical protein